MSITRETARSGFFIELSPAKRDEYLGLKQQKFLPNIDNLYYSYFLEGDKSEFESPNGLTELLGVLEQKKQEVARNYGEPVDFGQGLTAIDKLTGIDGNGEIEDEDDIAVSKKKYTMYGYCLTEPDLYDIFICKAIPNEQTPRIIVQHRAYGLWNRNKEEVVKHAYYRISRLLEQYCGMEFTIKRCRENRIDYCFHTNAISNVGALIRKNPRTEQVKNLHTNMKEAREHLEVKDAPGGVILKTDYICFGQVSSNNVRARIYDKVKEVIEKGYKEFFFKIWHDKGLISYYDKWCMEYAFPYRNTDYLYKAMVAFYVDHCAEYKKGVKSEKDIPSYYNRCRKALDNEKTSLADFKKLAKENMPKVTCILNIEYETKRKFYYYSDKFIGTFKTIKRDIPQPLERIYKILDNQGIFVEYLTRKSLSFYNGMDEKGEPKYLAWWQRLRNTKLEGIKIDEKLLREYSYNMDKRLVEQRAVNAVASAAVYVDDIGTGFVEDWTDFMSCLIDNKARGMFGRLVMVDTESGIMIENEDLSKEFNERYRLTKAKKERHLKNRKKRRGDKHEDV
jgi:hypothetical protein